MRSVSTHIPIQTGVNDYNLPLDFFAAATARFITNAQKYLTWRAQEYWDRVINDPTIVGVPSEFTTYNPNSELTQNYGETRLKFDRIPDSTDTFQLRYYRRFNTTGTSIDMPDQYLYKFLDYARAIMLEAKRAQDNPGEYRDSQIDSFNQAQQNDEERTPENDADNCMKSMYEMGENQRPLWGNGDFDATRW